jgi:MurNAc alpha-1-phosphate uridylyltransferase
VLETAGGIAKALPLLTDQSHNQPFLVVNADIYCEMNYASLLPVLQQMFLSADSKQAHLVLVDNPAHHPDGDFALDGTKVLSTGENKLTFSGIGIYQPKFFSHIKKNVAMKLAPLLCQEIDKNGVSATHYDGVWIDVGTPERLELLDRRLSQN